MMSLGCPSPAVRPPETPTSPSHPVIVLSPPSLLSTPQTTPTPKSARRSSGGEHSLDLEKLHLKQEQLALLDIEINLLKNKLLQSIESNRKLEQELLKLKSQTQEKLLNYQEKELSFQKAHSEISQYIKEINTKQ
eukprot:TRINITY_DN9918_c1_g1_i2.p1 TRINITY_DN9918_c1_g1~~TRINITY_DN9918_c1_g1_i2.p1  ORF type:complete len:135 (-),score=44.31 TRINITY_DN9918_c1_g1_i2:11-415(-)